MGIHVNVGEKWRIKETYPAGTTVTYEGEIEEVNERTVKFRSGENTGTLYAFHPGKSLKYASVFGEKLKDPLPVTRGSVVTLPSGEAFWLSQYGTWHDLDGSFRYRRDKMEAEDYKVVLDTAKFSRYVSKED